MVVDMNTESQFDDLFLKELEVSSSSASSIHVTWLISRNVLPFLEGLRVHYQKVASTYIQYGPNLSASQKEYEIKNLVADTYYKVCLVLYRNNSSPFRECVDASTTNWQLPVSIGSSVGAVLALSIIVLIVLISRCQLPKKYKRKKDNAPNKYDKYDSMAYQDTHYDFGETTARGIDDDFTSDFDNEEDTIIDPRNESNRHSRSQNERNSIDNGPSRVHVNPRHHHHSHEHRHSIGRVQCPTHSGHPHTRQFRAYSIQADGQACFFNQPCSPLAKELRTYSVGNEWDHVEEIYPRQDSPKTERISPNENSPIKCCVLKQDTEQKHPNLKLVFHHPQVLTYIDGIPETQPNLVSKSDISQDVSPIKTCEISDNLLIRDPQYEDTRVCDSVGCIKDTIVRQSYERRSDDRYTSVEMTSINKSYAVPERATFEEHAL